MWHSVFVNMKQGELYEDRVSRKTYYNRNNAQALHGCYSYGIVQ